MLEFIIDFTMKIREDEPQKQIKVEDILVHLIRDRRKFERACYIYYQNLRTESYKKQEKPERPRDQIKYLTELEFL